MAVSTVEVLLVERPTNALHRAALHLALDVRRVNGPASILDDRKAQDIHLAGLGIDLDVSDIGRKGASDARVWIHGGAANDGTAGLFESAGLVL